MTALGPAAGLSEVAEQNPFPERGSRGESAFPFLNKARFQLGMAGAQGRMLRFILETDARGGEAFKRLAEQMQGSGKPGRWSLPTFYLQEFLALLIYTMRSLDLNLFFFFF